ncbi:MAG TPA: Gfo/Idh/MocA family oxidoreductase [Pirellulales bacterium]|nr:Gfo/Idh/MocA family oxidoreductase [Pirellulales bacterium]
MTAETNDDRPAHPRRAFLNLRKPLVGAATLAGGLALYRSVHAAGDDTIKIALIGCGGRGTGATNQALSTSGPVKLVAMADAFDDRLQKSLTTLKRLQGERVDVPKERQFVGFDAYQRALAADPDLVILTTPPGFRPIHFEAAVKAGKHVFMEKPVAVDAAGVRSVLASAEEAKKRNLAVGVGFERRHRLNYLEAMKRIHDGAIGDVVYMRVYWNSDGVGWKERDPDDNEMTYQMRNWYYFNWLCGDHIVEQHVHLMDVANWVKGTHPVEANGLGGRQVKTGVEFGQNFDHHFVEFRYDDGVRLISQCRHIPGCWVSCSEHIVGTLGTCSIGEAGGAKIEGANPWQHNGRNDPNPYQVEHDVLFASIRSGQPINEAASGAISTMTSIFGRMATYSGQLLDWDKALNSPVRLAPADQQYSFDAEPPVLPDKAGAYPVAIPGVTEVI